MERTDRPALTPAQRKQRRNRRAAWLRAGIQALFFVAMPGAFSMGFSGVKYIFGQIGAGQALTWNSALAVLLGLSLFTILFGRFFCGYVCAFGSLGDLVYRLSGLVQTKLFKRKKPVRLPDRFTPWGQRLKYALLAAICLLCALGLYDRLRGWSPWSVFSFALAGRFRLEGYWPGLCLLILIVAGMAVKERFFCQFLCPMGALFALLPQMPFATLRRDPDNCLRGCQACRKQCPVDIKLEPDGFRNGECLGCERCAGVCPKNNLTRWDRRLWRHEAVAVAVRAVLFFGMGVWLGLCRFITL